MLADNDIVSRIQKDYKYCKETLFTGSDKAIQNIRDADKQQALIQLQVARQLVDSRMAELERYLNTR